MSPRHVAVVGAGPAGLAAARTALAAGARVTLIDAAEQPGGQYHRMLPEAYAADRPERLQHGWSAFDRHAAPGAGASALRLASGDGRMGAGAASVAGRAEGARAVRSG